MKQRAAAFVPYGILLGIDFYLLPLLAKDTGTAMLLMLCVMPLAAFTAALIYGMRRGFSILLPIIAVLFFIPTLFLYYNLSAWGYAAVYAAVVLAGNSLGKLLYRKK